MAIIHGQVESLKKVKATLAEEGITQFSSIGEMNAFLANYDSQSEQIKNDVIDVYNDELDQIKRKRERQLKLYIDLKNEENKKLNIELDNLRVKIDEIDKKGFFARFKRRKLSKQLRKQEREFDDIVSKRIADLEKEFQKANAQLHDFEKNQSNILEEKINTAVNELRRTKRVVEDLSSLMAGAVGEYAVEKEISKLSDDYVLINDFSLDFNPPIYNKRENDRIYSIQIDHLLISRAGIFILETKNWSKKSLENLDMRSPVEQIKRSSFALFVFLSKNFSLGFHHWGEKKIPIRNVIVMINNKPKESFKFVQIKQLNELNRYVEYFEPVLDREEVSSIANFMLHVF